ncbi:hypothetical protein [Legionella beliardensis]|nr:hypothetical protein [Legionella beliardensis]
MKKFFEVSVKNKLAPDVMHAPMGADICNCTMCMKSKLSAEIVSEHLHGLQSTLVDRRNPDIPGSKTLMKAVEAHAILKAGTEINMLAATGISEYDLPSATGKIQITPVQELTINATWKNKNQEAAISGRDASVFGGLGVLVIPQDIQVVTIPKMNALAVPAAFLGKYGARLIPLEKSFTLDAVNEPSLENLYLIEYRWQADYINDYVMKANGGGGLFVETHPFPHVFTPLSPECGGALILGVERDDGAFDFAAFEIPFGYTLKIGSNVIHGDSFFIGPYAIALTETELADSVLLKRGTLKREPQQVTQIPTKTFILDLIHENSLATKVNHKMMVDRIYHEGVSRKGLGFFKQLPKEVLTEVRHLSNASQEAYDQECGLVPYLPK